MILFLQEAYEILTKYEAEMTKREAEEVYNLRHSFTKLHSKAVSIIVSFMLFVVVVVGFFLGGGGVGRRVCQVTAEGSTEWAEVACSNLAALILYRYLSPLKKKKKLNEYNPVCTFFIQLDQQHSQLISLKDLGGFETNRKKNLTPTATCNTATIKQCFICEAPVHLLVILMKRITPPAGD